MWCRRPLRKASALKRPMSTWIKERELYNKPGPAKAHMCNNCYAEEMCVAVYILDFTEFPLSSVLANFDFSVYRLLYDRAVELL